MRSCSTSSSTSSSPTTTSSSSSSYYESESKTTDSEDVSTDEFESPSKTTELRSGTKLKISSDSNLDDNISSYNCANSSKKTALHNGTKRRKVTSDAHSDDNVNSYNCGDDEKIHKIVKIMLEQLKFPIEKNSLIELDKHNTVSDSLTESNNTNEALIVEIKNTNPDFHIHHELYKNECILCQCKPNKSIVAHYVNDHPNNEIYVSRLTSDVADAFLQKQIIRTSVTKRNQKSYETICPFCKQFKGQNKGGWIHHLTTHTGEYGYFCPKCNARNAMISKTHRCDKGGNIIRMEKIAGFIKCDDDNINAFMCKLCNYVQFNKQHIIEHLKVQHELVDDINSNLLEITLIKICGPKTKRKLRKSEIAELLNPLGYLNEKEIEPTTTYSEECSNTSVVDSATQKTEVLYNNELDDIKVEFDETLSASNNDQKIEPPTDMVDDIALVLKTQYGEIISDEAPTSLAESVTPTQPTQTPKTTTMDIVCEGKIEDVIELISILETTENKVQCKIFLYLFINCFCRNVFSLT